MNPKNNMFKTISLIGAFVLAAATSQAVSPPPDGGYPNQTTAEGENALFSLTTGVNNTALGFEALYSNTIGNYNTATGVQALFSNTNGEYNTAVGSYALSANMTGTDNTACGAFALSGGDGSGNTATGAFSLQSNAGGRENTADGNSALRYNTTGVGNTANGIYALINNETGSYNTAVGWDALDNNGTGDSNIALGFEAGFLLTGDNNIAIGNLGVPNESGIIRIGTAGTHRAAVIAGVHSATIAAGVPVFVNREGRLGITTSSERFKDKIKPMDKSSEAILALKPVTFHYKKDLDPDGIPQFGLVAEQVEKVNPDLVARDEQGKPYTVRYEAVNAMLLNEFLKEHKKVEELTNEIADLKTAVNELKASQKFD